MSSSHPPLPRPVAGLARRRAAKHTARSSAYLASEDASDDGIDGADAPDSQCYVCLGSSEDGDLSKRHRGVMIHRHCMAAMRAYTRLLKDPQVGREGYEVGRYIDMWLYSYWYVGIHI